MRIEVPKILFHGAHRVDEHIAATRKRMGKQITMLPGQLHDGGGLSQTTLQETLAQIPMDLTSQARPMRERLP